MTHGEPIDKLVFVIQNITSTHRLTALISLVSLGILILAKITKPKISRRLSWVQYIPEILIVVVVATSTSKGEKEKRRLRIVGFPKGAGRCNMLSLTCSVSLSLLQRQPFP